MKEDVVTQSIFLQLAEGKVYLASWIPQSNNGKSPQAVPIVLLHDSLGCVGTWRVFPYVLAKLLQRPVIAYDRLGFGQSDAMRHLPGFDFIAQEATRYFPQIKAQIGLSQYILMGHSVGGAMAVEIASRDKDCIALITESAQAFVEVKTREGIRRAREQFANPSYREKLDRWHGKKTTWVLEAWIDVWLDNAFSDWSLEESITRIDCPVLAIHGEQDEYGSLAFPRFITEKSSGPGEMFLLNECGHVPHRSHPEQVLNKIHQFLQVYGV